MAPLLHVRGATPPSATDGSGVSRDDHVARVLARGGEAGTLARSVDWSATAIGPVEQWSPALRAAASLVLHSDWGMLLWWGPDFVQIYNDAYRPVLGDKHPRAMGQPFRECWREVFHILGPMAERPFRGGAASTSDDMPLLLHRKVDREETHFRLAYSPVPDDTVKDTGVGGVLAVVTEITEQVYAERQLKTLRTLGAAVTAEERSAESACKAAAKTLTQNPWDVPFSLFFLLDEDGRHARLVATSGFEAVDSEYVGPRELVLATDGDHDRRRSGPAVIGFERALDEGRIVIQSDLSTWPFELPESPWGDSPASAILLPLASPDQRQPYGVLVCGLSPHRVLDAGYRSFFELATAQIVTAIRNARVLQEQRRRTEELAAIDRAKTAFFSNVSHEFRTPLTLMLGPQEDALQTDGSISGDALRTVHRNTLRLLKLVNSLLEFSRIEAGRAKVSYQPTDLSTFTRELVGTFRSAVEGGGLELEVDCAPLPEPVYVDRDMWERIVLNLVSNAFKFTLEGRIRVTQRLDDEFVVLTVSDTGAGIPAEALPRLFERFYRIEGTRARTHEGSGIGLALVHDMVALHGGGIEVESELGRGTTFTVFLPRGSAHLPSEHVGSASEVASPSDGGADAFLAEAMRWLPDDDAASTFTSADTFVGTALPGRVLVVDDNADMRGYVARLLRAYWDVEVATDGNEALARVAASQPDIIVSDVMMPNLDGFGLLRALRNSSATASIPVILLSARAGDEMRVDGLEAGADDYLVKPFSAKELLARVRVHLENASLRRTAEAARAEAEAANRAKDDFLAMLGHELRNPLSPIVTALEIMRRRGVNAREHDVIERQVGHLIRLVEDLLDVSRIARGKIELRKARTELSQVVLRGLETANPLLVQRRQTVHVHVDTAGLAVEVDSERIAQVVSNLVTNAAKYSDPGSIINVRATRDGDNVRLRVRDSGIGIAKEMLAKIFDIFFQQPQALDRSKGGLGLGLAIVRSITELHGGSVTATSDGPGKGSEFVVTLPLANPTISPSLPDHGGSAPLEARGASESRSGRRILVVDDNADAAEGVADLLRTMGHDILTAYDGPAALRAAATFRPDICLLDIGLPMMDGYELAQRLHELPELGHARLIAISGYGQESDQRRSLNAGFDVHLVKPVDMDVLSRVVGR